MKIRQLSAVELSVAKRDRIALFSPFRRGAGFSEKEQEAIFLGQLGAACDQGGEVWCLADADGLGALAAFWPLAHDSAFFGVSMGSLLVAAAPEVSPDRLLALVGRALEQARVHYQHLCVEVDIDDYPVFNALAAHQFALLDIKRTYYAKRFREDIDVLRYQQFLRPYRADDYSRVMDVVSQADFPSRFSRDLSLPQDKVKAFKEQWFSRILQKPEEQRLAWVFERQGRIEACGTVDETDFSPLGVPRKMMLGGLYASTVSGTGGYIPLLHQLVLESINRYGVGGTTVSLNNTPAIRAIESFRSYSGSVIRHVLCRNFRQAG